MRHSQTEEGKKLVALGIDKKKIDALSQEDFSENFAVESVYELISIVKSTLTHEINASDRTLANKAFEKVQDLYEGNFDAFSRLVDNPFVGRGVLVEIDIALGLRPSEPSSEALTSHYVTQSGLNHTELTGEYDSDGDSIE